jgi:hypothetical protein
MGYNPPPPPLSYTMTRNSIPPPPPPPPPKRIINEGWPSITKPKKKEKRLVDIRDKHGKIRLDVRIDAEGFPIVKIVNPNEDGYLKVKLHKDAKDEDVKNVVAQYYSGYSVPSFSNEDYYGKIRVDDIKHKNEIELQKMGVRKASNGMAQIEGSIENSKALTKEQLKKDADPPKKKPKPEPKPEYGEAMNITKKKSRWDRFIDRIIKNIVWGK